VFDALIYDIDGFSLYVFIEELNLNVTVRLREDIRIDSTTYFDDEVEIVAYFKSPIALEPTLREYTGDRTLYKSKQQEIRE